MTRDELISAGCMMMHWNPSMSGGFHEYYLAVNGDGFSHNSIRLSATFGWFGLPSDACTTWLVSDAFRLRLDHICTIDQFLQIYALLTGGAKEDQK